MSPLRVLIVDDQALMRSGFSLIVGAEADLEVVGEAADGAAALDAARGSRPDLVLMDVRMPVMDGIEATRRLVAEGLGPVLVLTTFDDDEHLFDALDAGASGFLLKNADPDELVAAIRTVAAGEALLDPGVTRQVIERAGATGAGAPSPAGSAPYGTPAPRAVELDRLTARETEILTLVAEGLSNAEIAARLFVGEATVKSHVSSCLSKLHLRDRVQAVVFAYEAGLTRPGGR